jgi:LmbE family N-acetylglucosaminyl deacetylase
VIYPSSADVPGTGYDYIYLSPHLDDVILSCGGAIVAARRRGARVLVATVCTGSPAPDLPDSPLAEQLHASWKLRRDEVMPVRLGEDERALAIVDADGLRLGFLDAVYRLPSRYASEDELFGAIAPADPLPRALGEVVRALAERVPATFYLPLGVGRHVDHQITHQVWRGLAARGSRLAFYEDVPYSLTAGRLEQRLGEVGVALVAEDIDVTDTLARKVEAARAYASQVDSLFGSDTEMRRLLELQASSYDRSLLAERSWLL